MIKKPFIKKKKRSKTKSIKTTANLTIQRTSSNTLFHAQCINHSGFIVSAGIIGLKGARRSSVYAARQTTLFFSNKLKEKGIDSAFIFFKGFGWGKKSLIKILKKKIKILQIFDKTVISHNGCRTSKKRRL